MTIRKPFIQVIMFCLLAFLSTSGTAQRGSIPARSEEFGTSSSAPQQAVPPQLPDAPLLGQSSASANLPNSTSADFDRKGWNTDCAYLNAFAGTGISFRNGKTQATYLGGFTIGQYFARTFGKGESLSPQFELGAIGPISDGNLADGFVSVQEMLSNKIPAHHQYLSATAGYTRFFVTGDALNLGLGFDFGNQEYDRLMRVEIRDYYIFDGPRQNILSVRIGFGKFVSD